MRRLPHTVSLQSHALRQRGFSEQEQAELRRVIGAHDHSMAASILTAALGSRVVRGIRCEKLPGCWR